MKRAFRGLLALLLLGLIKVAWVAGATVAPQRDLELRASHLVARLEAGDAGLVPGSDRFAGEWGIVSRSMTALALVRLAKDDPSKHDTYAAAVHAIANSALAPDARAFDTAAWGTDALDELACNSGHAGYLGHLGLILAAERILGGHAHDEVEGAVADAIEIRLDAGGLVLTYPGEEYVPDNVVLAAALALHARASEVEQHERLAGWVSDMRANEIDPATGLLVFAPNQPPRGSGAAWNSYFLPMIDRDFAREQQTALERLVVRLPLGTAALRDGTSEGDVDSGPLVFGISPAATGFAIAGARCFGNEELARALERTAEIVGMTVPTARGRSYLFAPLVGDAVILAMRAGPPIGC